jgi:hypothetical protein
MLPNPNAGIHTETTTIGLSLHSFSIITVNVTTLHERSEQSLANRLLHLGDKLCTEGLGCEELDDLVDLSKKQAQPANWVYSTSRRNAGRSPDF